MPAKHTIKQFIENGYYHIYNRGVEKQRIFRDEQDYAVFLSYLKIYLEPKDEFALSHIISDPLTSQKQKDTARSQLRLNNFFDSIRLICYCLMPNHFHFLLKQTRPDTIDRFMNSFGTRYTMFMNGKYKRVGPLFQNVYKAVFVESNAQLLHLTRYIHRNPLPHLYTGVKKSLEERMRSRAKLLRSYTYSSYADYLGKRRTSWVHPNDILTSFAKSGSCSYQSFIEDVEYSTVGVDIIKDVVIDDDFC